MSRTRVASLAAICLALLLAPAGAAGATKATECAGENDPVTDANLASAERTLLCAVNVYRTANGLPLLTEDPALMRAARGHSEYQEQTGQIGHVGLGNGTPTTRAEAEGFDCGGFEYVGENAARTNFPGFTPKEMLQGWKDSPPHDENLREPGYVTAGMGFALGPNNGLTGTQKFSGVTNGATGTAADLLTSSACTAAEAKVGAAERKVKAAKKKVAGADGTQEKRRAKAKLRRARLKLKSAGAKATTACDLTY